MTWAAAIIALNNGRAAGSSYLFRTADGKDSTLLYKILASGHPTPQVWRRGGSPGPVLDADNLFPGTMRLFFHPFWTILEDTELPFLRSVYTKMSALKGPAHDHFKRCTEARDPRLPKRYVDGLAHALIQDGSLDSLGGVVLLVQQAYLLCDDDAYTIVLERMLAAIENWQWLQWMPAPLRSAIQAEIVTSLLRWAPAHLDHDLAGEDAASRLLLLAADDPEMTSARLEEFWNELGNRTGLSVVPALSESTLPKRAFAALKAGTDNTFAKRPSTHSQFD